MLWPELALAALLIALDVTARLVLHLPNVSPVAASALFAGVMLRHRSLAVAVPLAAMAIADTFTGFYDWRVMAVVYAATMLPAFAGMLARTRAFRVVIPTMLACSLIFFVSTNFAVWAFSGLYSLDMAGLIQCYVAALPFLKYTLIGDLLWTTAMFGGAALAPRAIAFAR